jgi:hypothetical protein
MNTYYVYEHYKPHNNLPFYIGKGKNNRAYVKSNRSKYWHNIVNKHGYLVKFIIKNINEELALFVEKERIDQLKQLNINICNLTLGGDGISGYKFTDKQKKNLSDSHKGYKPSEETLKKLSLIRKGKIKSKEWKEKISLGNKGKKRTIEQNKINAQRHSKKVYCITTNKYFNSAKEASRFYGLSDGAVSCVCSGKNKSVKKMKFCYINDKKEI